MTRRPRVRLTSREDRRIGKGAPCTSLRWLRQLRPGEPYRSEGCRAEAQRAKAGGYWVRQLRPGESSRSEGCRAEAQRAKAGGAAQISDLIFQTATTICVCHLAARCARVMQEIRPRKSEGAGNAGCPMHPQPVCIGSKHTVVTTGTPESPGIPCAMVLTAYTVLSPATNSSCHRRRRING